MEGALSPDTCNRLWSGDGESPSFRPRLRNETGGRDSSVQCVTTTGLSMFSGNIGGLSERSRLPSRRDFSEGLSESFSRSSRSSLASHAFLGSSRSLSEDLSRLLPNSGPRDTDSLSFFGSRSDSVQLVPGPSKEYQLKGRAITYNLLTRVRYSPQIKSNKSSVREFDVRPRRSDILELEACHLFGKKNLKEDETMILMMFDRLEPLVNPVRNEPDFQGKLKRLMYVCHTLADSKSPLRYHLQEEANMLLKEIDNVIQETMSPLAVGDTSFSL